MMQVVSLYDDLSLIDDFFTTLYPYGFLQATMNKQQIHGVAVSSVFFSFTSVRFLNGLCCFQRLFKKFFFLSKQTGNKTNSVKSR